MPTPDFSASTLPRRHFISLSALALGAAFSGHVLRGAAESSVPPTTNLRPAAKKNIPIGLELYSVRGQLLVNLPETLRAVSKMGYEDVEFFAPFLTWSYAFAKDVRSLLDDLGLRCLSTHNNFPAYSDPVITAKAIELNQILGARYVMLSSTPKTVVGLEAWKKVCAQITTMSATLQTHGLAGGYHNHQTEWKPLENGQAIMQLLAAHTPPEFALQLDVGTALESGADPVAWIKANPGRIKSVHLKEWQPGTNAEGKGYRVLFGEGIAPWKEIIAAAESVGGVEFYLMEQEGSRFGELETAQRCLEAWKKLRAEV